MAVLKPSEIIAIVDTREINAWDLSPLAHEVATLETGDYSVKGLEHVIRIERKSESDLLSCVGGERERFEREIQRLLGFPSRALIVESSWTRVESGDWRSKVTSNAVIGSLLGWMALGLPIILADNHQHAALYARRLLFIVARRRYKENVALSKAVSKT